ncbi:MAG: helix-turn-helix domain-containing protein [Erysipelotrichaceae bacterium]
MQNFNIYSETIKERKVFFSESDTICIVYINSGTGQYLFNNDIDVYLKNSVFILSPKTKFSITPTSKYNCTVTTLYFDKSFINHTLFHQASKLVKSLKIDEDSMYRISLSATSGHSILPYLDIMTKEYNNLVPFSWFLIQNTLASLMVYLTRINSLSEENERNSPRNNINLVERVKLSIENNFEKQISLNTLAHDFFVNPSYLSHSFKKKTNISLTNYIINTRIENAKLMLLDTDELIIDIAISCGFNTIAHFNSCFKKNEKLTPSKYRALYKTKPKERLF